MKRIAIVGAGVAGLTLALEISAVAEVTVFEKCITYKRSDTVGELYSVNFQLLKSLFYRADLITYQSCQARVKYS